MASQPTNPDNLTIVRGDILQDEGMIVIPVNCVPGVMGAGLARQFADRYPNAKAKHRDAVKILGMKVGQPTLCWGAAPRAVVYFPTKDHWRDPSNLAWISSGLDFLSRIMRDADEAFQDETLWVRDAGIAIPALGCGLGGLAWEPVREAVAAFAGSLPDGWRVRLYDNR